MTRQLEQAFTSYLLARSSATALADCSIRAGVPPDALSYPAVIVAAGGEALLEGGVRRASRVDLDVSVVTAAAAAGWQNAHRDRVAALAGLVDDCATQSALNTINSGQADFTVYGWVITEIASETASDHQTDSFRLSVIAGERELGAPAGTNEPAQTFSLRHELEEVVAERITTGAPDGYAVRAGYSEQPITSSRIVAAVASAAKPYPQMRRYQAQLSVHIITGGHDATAHAGVAQLVADAMRAISPNDLASSRLTISGALKSAHTVDIAGDRMTDVLTFGVWATVN